MSARMIVGTAVALSALPAVAQVSMQDVISGAANNPNATEDNRQRSEGFNRDFTEQLIETLTTDEPQEYESVYDRYYGEGSGYREDYNNPGHVESYDEPRDTYSDSGADEELPLSANRPDEAWQRVHSAQPYGTKRAAFDGLEDHVLSEGDLLSATDDTGMIDVNAIPDSSSANRPSASSSTLPSLDDAGTCCPSSTDSVDWWGFYGFCQRTTFVDVNGDGGPDLDGQRIELFAEGIKTAGGVCEVGPPVDNPFLDGETQGR